MRGLCVKIWRLSQPISRPRPIALLMPPEEETWAPTSLPLRAHGGESMERRLGKEVLGVGAALLGELADERDGLRVIRVGLLGELDEGRVVRVGLADLIDDAVAGR